MDTKNIELSIEEWESIYASVYREYKRTFTKVLHDSLKRRKYLSDTSAERWLNLIHKIEKHIELAELDLNSRN